MPPVEPRPSTGGAPKTPMIASCRAANFRCNTAAIFSACNSGCSFRSSNGLRMTNIPPTLLMFVPNSVE